MNDISSPTPSLAIHAFSPSSPSSPTPTDWADLFTAMYSNTKFTNYFSYQNMTNSYENENFLMVWGSQLVDLFSLI